MRTPRAHATDDENWVDAFIWEVVDVAARSLDQVNGTAQAEITLRLLKIAEEYGEAVQAWIGVTGQNPRKGITHTRRQVADELGDVAITALVAASSIGFDPRQVLADTAAKVATRFSIPGSPPDSGSTPRAQGGDDGDGRGDAFIWAWVSADFRQLDGKTGSEPDEITLRLLKIAEEFGEAAQAWIGFTGQNPSKGVTHTRQQVAGELGDVAFGALVTAASMGFDPRQVLIDTATKVAARYGIPSPADTELTPPAALPAAGPEVDHTGKAAPPAVVPAGGDLFTNLLEIADAQTRRFPEHHGPFARIARLAEETDALAQQVNHAEGIGVNNAEYGPFDPANLAAEIADVLQAAAGIAAHYDLAGLVRAAVAARHTRDLLPTPPAPAASAPAQPDPTGPDAG